MRARGVSVVLVGRAGLAGGSGFGLHKRAMCERSEPTTRTSNKITVTIGGGIPRARVLAPVAALRALTVGLASGARVVTTCGGPHGLCARGRLGMLLGVTRGMVVTNSLGTERRA